MSQYLRNQYEVNSRVPYPGDPHAYYSFAQAFNQAAASKQPLTSLQQQYFYFVPWDIYEKSMILDCMEFK